MKKNHSESVYKLKYHIHVFFTAAIGGGRRRWSVLLLLTLCLQGCTLITKQRLRWADQCPRLNRCYVFILRSKDYSSIQALTSALSKKFLVPDRTSQATLSWLVPPPTVKDNTTPPHHTHKTQHMHLAFVSEQQSKRHASVGDVNLSSVWTEISCVEQICYCCYTDTGSKNCRRLSVSYLCWQWTGQLCEWQTGWLTERDTQRGTQPVIQAIYSHTADVFIINTVRPFIKYKPAFSGPHAQKHQSS